MEEDLRCKEDLKYDLWNLRRKLEENSEEISSVALLSPACFLLFWFMKIWVWNGLTEIAHFI